MAYRVKGAKSSPVKTGAYLIAIISKYECTIFPVHANTYTIAMMP